MEGHSAVSELSEPYPKCLDVEVHPLGPSGLLNRVWKAVAVGTTATGGGDGCSSRPGGGQLGGRSGQVWLNVKPRWRKELQVLGINSQCGTSFSIVHAISIGWAEDSFQSSKRVIEVWIPIGCDCENLKMLLRCNFGRVSDSDAENVSRYHGGIVCQQLVSSRV